MKNGRKIFIILLLAAHIFALLILPVSANSAQTEWSGEDSMGVAVVDGDCPIEVKREILTFDIPIFPNYSYSASVEDLENYSAKVTAEYTFLNPTDLTVTAKLAFPFGSIPWSYSGYFDENDQFIEHSDTDKYDITVNGETVDRNIRYTVEKARNEFDLEKALSHLSDEYITSGLFAPDATVTRYRYTVDTISNFGSYNSPGVLLDWDGNGGKTVICFSNGSRTVGKNGENEFYKARTSPGDVLVVYAIGEPLSEPLDWKFYNDFYSKKSSEIKGEVSLKSTETLSLEDFALSSRSDEEKEISKVDWYNIVVSQFIDSLEQDTFVFSYGNDPSSLSHPYELMRWYEYEITLAPGESIVNTVTAPVYPDLSTKYSPPIYTYNYLLSPASTWASFGELEININTPYYIQGGSSTVGSFERTDSGYTVTLDGLPDGELVFTLSKSENPERKKSPYGTLLSIIFVVVMYVIIAVPVVSIIAIIVMIKKRKR